MSDRGQVSVRLLQVSFEIPPPFTGVLVHGESPKELRGVLLECKVFGDSVRWAETRVLKNGHASVSKRAF